MTRQAFEQCLEAHDKEVNEIRQAAHDLHASVNQTYDGDKPYGIHLDMVAAAVHEHTGIV